MVRSSNDMESVPRVVASTNVDNSCANLESVQFQEVKTEGGYDTPCRTQDQNISIGSDGDHNYRLKIGSVDTLCECKQKCKDNWKPDDESTSDAVCKAIEWNASGSSCELHYGQMYASTDESPPSGMKCFNMGCNKGYTFNATTGRCEQLTCEDLKDTECETGKEYDETKATYTATDSDYMLKCCRETNTTKQEDSYWWWIGFGAFVVLVLVLGGIAFALTSKKAIENNKTLANSQLLPKGG